MRAWVAILSAALAITALAPAASGHIGAVQNDAAGAQTVSEEDLCIPTCENLARSEGYISAVTVIQNNTTVAWATDDNGVHTVTSDVAADDKPAMITGGPPPFRDWCIQSEIQPYSPARITFSIHDGRLKVFEEKRPDAGWRVCPQAQALPGGALLLSYHCNYHPRLQHGAVVVLPAA